MLAPHVFIGVGGSGGATLRYLARELERRFETIGWTDPLPNAYQFLHIDVPYADDTTRSDPTVPVDLGTEIAYLNLAVPPRAEYAPYDAENASGQFTAPSYLKWRTNPRAGYPSVSLGAGQRRTIGRVLALSQHKRMKESMEWHIKHAPSTESTASLSRLAQKLHQLDDTTPSTISSKVSVMVFSSVAGGSGAGVVIDVLEILRAMSGDVAELNKPGAVSTFLYTSEIFRGVQGTAAVHANSLAAMCELINAHEYENKLPADASSLLGIDGTFPDGSTHRIPPCTFIVGASNGTVNFERQSDVYDSMGKGIAALVANPRTSGQYKSYVQTNVTTSPMTVQKDFRSLIAGNATWPQPVAALGFGSVSLGQKLFADYAAENLSSRAIERLLNGHMAIGEDTGRGDEAVLDDLAEKLRAGFVSRCGLSELNGNDQVIDLLLTFGSDTTLDDRAKSYVNDLIKTEMGKAAPSKQFRLPSHWQAGLKPKFQDGEIKFPAEELTRLNELGPVWARRVQQDIVLATQETVARYGFPLALALLGKLDDELTDASSELRKEAEQSKSEEVGWLKQFESGFSVTKAKEKLAGTSTPVKTAISAFLKSITQMARRNAKKEAAELLDLLRTDLLPQVISDVDAARRLLQGQCSGVDQQLVRSWSQAQVPTHLLASENEQLLIPQSTYQSTFESAVGQIEFNVGSETADADAISEAVTEVILGSWPESGKKAADGKLMRVDKTWAPVELAGNNGFGVTRPSHEFEFVGKGPEAEFSPKALLGQAERWVRTRDGRVSQIVSEDLAKWLNADGKKVEQAERGDKFVVELRGAIAASAPMANINANAYKAFYGKMPPAPFPICSMIPIAKNHPAYAAVVEELKTVLPESAVASLLDPNAVVGDVEILSLTDHLIHPFAFNSFTSPIVADWERHADPDGAREFWQFRRARPLEEFVPISASRQKSFIRGWAIARILGRLESVSDRRWSDSPLSVWTEDGDAEFPRLLLGGDPKPNFSALPYVLESVALGFLDFADGKSKSLDAYRALIELGMYEGDPHVTASRMPKALNQWLISGKLKEKGAPTPPPELAGTFADESQARRDAAIAFLARASDAVRSSYEDSDLPGVDDYSRGHYMWSIKELVLDTLTELQEVIAEAGDGDGKFDTI